MTGLEELVESFAHLVALLLDVVSILVVAIGALVAIGRAAAMASDVNRRTQIFRSTWQGLARSLLLGLEFMLAADVVETTISPDWTSIGQLAAIAAIRTFLNHFLERDIEAAKELREAVEP